MGHFQIQQCHTMSTIFHYLPVNKQAHLSQINLSGGGDFVSLKPLATTFFFCEPWKDSLQKVPKTNICPMNLGNRDRVLGRGFPSYQCGWAQFQRLAGVTSKHNQVNCTRFPKLPGAQHKSQAIQVFSPGTVCHKFNLRSFISPMLL